MIYCIGNSHVNFFTKTHPSIRNTVSVCDSFTSFNIGPVIAYNYYEHHLTKTYDALKACGAPLGAQVLMVVGEVDCRWHLPKRVSETRMKPEMIVTQCAQRFFRAVLDVKSKGYKPILWGGHPSTTAGHNDAVDGPIWGDCLTRNRISNLWTNKLVEFAKPTKIPLVSLLHLLIDEHNLTRMEYFMDYCHLDSDKLLPTAIQLFKNQRLL